MNLIAAVDARWGLGKNDRLLLRIPGDLKRFRQLTLGGTVILGRKTLQTFPAGAPLSGRDNIILSGAADFQAPGATVVHSIPALLRLVARRQPDSVWAIGGASVYRQLLPYCRYAYITHIDADLSADCFLPALDRSPSWQVAEAEESFLFQQLECRYVKYENVGVLPLLG